MDGDEVDTSGHDEAGPDSPLNPSGSSLFRRACDACRVRKVRCNRESPCSQCLHAQIECSYTVSVLKQKRSRIHLTPQYEKKIDIIDQRLQTVTQLLKDLKKNAEAQSPKDTQLFTAIAKHPMRNQITDTNSSGPSSVVTEGDSSLTAHSVFANEFLKSAVKASSLQDCSLEMQDTLDSLRHIVDKLRHQSSEMQYPQVTPAQLQPAPQIELPPIQKALSLICAATPQVPGGTAWFYSFLQMDRLSDLCLKVYCSENYSEAEFIIVNSGLHYLFWDEASQVGDPYKDEALQMANICNANLETALSNIPLHLPATQDMILALLFGAFHTIEISKPSLSWILTSKASELCQTLGYHRASSLKSGTAQEVQYRQLLFWSTYYLDKSLSLRLGRASSIAEWDISTPLPRPNDPRNSPLLSASFCWWIRTSRCQGNIYMMLYSPESMLRPDHVRKARVETLASDLGEIIEGANKTNEELISEAKSTRGEGLMEFLAVSDHVFRLSLSTLIHRASPPNFASPPTAFSSECILAARASLQRHHDCMIMLDKVDSIHLPSYINWTVLFAPFIPFIVLFCQIIETRDDVDLGHLRGFILSIQPTQTASDAAAKLYRLFQVLYSVALRYVEFHHTSEGQHSQAGIEMDTYMAALGFPARGINSENPLGFPNNPEGGTMTESETHCSSDSMAWIGNTAPLEDWFDTNQQMMALLQDENFDFPPIY